MENKIKNVFLMRVEAPFIDELLETRPRPNDLLDYLGRLLPLLDIDIEFGSSTTCSQALFGLTQVHLTSVTVIVLKFHCGLHIAIEAGM